MLKRWLNTRLEAMMRETPGQHVQYLGHHGVTQYCVEAVERVLLRHREIVSVRLLSCRYRHAYLFTLAYHEFVIVRAGFTSDSGEGSRGLRRTLNLIQSVGLEIEESDVEDEVFYRLNQATLTHDDFERLRKLRFVRPKRLWDYGMSVCQEAERRGQLWEQAESLIPLALIDPRLFDLAVGFWSSPDTALLKGFRRLEGMIRERVGGKGYGKNMLANAFQSPSSILTWEGLDDNQQNGRASLFIGSFAAFRNDRFHYEADDLLPDALREFLLLNQLYIFEAQAIERE